MTSPLQKVPFIQRVALYAAKRHVDPLYLSQVSTAFSETLQSSDYGTTSTIYHNLLQYELKLAKIRQQALDAAKSNNNNNDDAAQIQQQQHAPFVRNEPLPTDYFLFHLCASPDHKERFFWLIESLIQTKDLWLDYPNEINGKMTPLVAAVICANERTVDLLLHHGANPNVGRRGESAVTNGSYPVYLAALKGKLKMLKSLLEAGGMVAPTNHELSPIFSALKAKSSSCLKLLVEKGNGNFAAMKTIGKQNVIDLCCASNYFDGLLFILKKVNDDDAALAEKKATTTTATSAAEDEDNGGVPKLSDFGLPTLLAHRLIPRETVSGSPIASPLEVAMKCGNEKMFKLILRYCKLDIERQNKLRPKKQMTLADSYTNVVYGLAHENQNQLGATLLAEKLSQIGKSLQEKSAATTAAAENQQQQQHEEESILCKDLESFMNELEVDPFAPVSFSKGALDTIKATYAQIATTSLTTTNTFHYLFAHGVKNFHLSQVLSSTLLKASSLTSQEKLKALGSAQGIVVFVKTPSAASSATTKSAPAAAAAAVVQLKACSVIELLSNKALSGGKNERKKISGKSFGNVETEILEMLNEKVGKLSDIIKSDPVLKKIAEEIVKEAKPVTATKSVLVRLKTLVV